MTEDEALVAALEVLRHYRTRAHTPTDHDGWLAVRSLVSIDAVAAADRLMAYAKQQRLLTTIDPYN